MAPTCCRCSKARFTVRSSEGSKAPCRKLQTPACESSSSTTGVGHEEAKGRQGPLVVIRITSCHCWRASGRLHVRTSETVPYGLKGPAETTIILSSVSHCCSQPCSARVVPISHRERHGLGESGGLSEARDAKSEVAPGFDAAVAEILPPGSTRGLCALSLPIGLGAPSGAGRVAATRGWSRFAMME